MPWNTNLVPWSARRRKLYHWTALMMINPLLVMSLRQYKFVRYASVTSEMISVHRILHEIPIEIAIERHRCNARSAQTDSFCIVTCIDLIILAVQSKLHSHVRGVEKTTRARSGAHDCDRNSGRSDGACEFLIYLRVAVLISYLDVCASLCLLNKTDRFSRF